ncbi:hypothetical protein J5N97_005860 [Dioscorea zingiberensis]|uniref:MTD1 n=1 Tax=Dioscorea zingiberensis TaxID=325984 RepID=A0A9D5DAJ4_9LILI|nr:hypothetical protein J5N97_005860 [Dioscorea zingiberensis]
MSIACKPVYEVVAGVRPEGKRFDASPPATAVAAESSSSSSIGENSDDGSGGDGSLSDSEEVQSEFKGPLNALEALEESLPIRRGISKFYCGKSKSFTSLADAESSSAKDIVKPDNAYSRKRKNLLAHKTFWERPHDNLLRNPGGGGMSKRPASSNRSITGNTENENGSDNNQETLDKVRHLPPLHPPGPPGKQAGGVSAFSSSLMKKCSFSMRSFSMMDLQGTSNSRPSTDPADKHNVFS